MAKPLKLTIKQQATLSTLLRDGARPSYPGLSLQTLESLRVRRFVASKSRLGAMFSPTTNVDWALTDEGREVAILLGDNNGT